MSDDGSLPDFPPTPSGVELRLLRAFVIVAQELNIGRAAARLFISPPALSRQIASLERALGCELLKRSTHSMELTLAGEALLDRLPQVLTDLDHAVSITRSVGDELTERAARMWGPVASLQAAADAELDESRAAFEALHARFSPPDGVATTAVNAGGVPALLLTPSSGAAATLLYLHGGGGIIGSAFGFRHLAGALADAAESAVLLPDYRLAPEHPYPAAVDDVLRAYLWLIGGGTPPEQVTLAGDSGGGGLLMSLLWTLKQDGLPLPGGAVLCTPWVDLTYAEAEGAHSEEFVQQLREAAASYLAGRRADLPEVNPLAADLGGYPAMLIQAATGDPHAWEAQRLHEHARSHGVDARLELYPTAAHAFHYFWSFLPEAADAVRNAGAFARDVRARQPRVAPQPR